MKVARTLLIPTALLSVSLILSSLPSLAQTQAVRARVTQSVDMQNLVILRGNVHPLARPEFDQGVAPDDLPMERMLLVLQRGSDQEAALRQLLDDQQVKSSPRFHQWLTPEQFGQQFGPADSDLQAVTDWLASQGFEVKKVAAGRTVIEFSGTAGSVRQALGTEIHRFRVNGEDHWANTADPQIPAALAPVVAGFASMNNFPRKPMSHSLGTFSRSKATGEVRPLFTYLSPSYNTTYYALGPTDFATIYNVLPLWNNGTDGTGQTIAVVAEGNINPQDVVDFRTVFGLPVNPPNIILNGPDPGITSFDETEADLDVEWTGAVAKGATIDLVVSESTETTFGYDLSALYIVDNNLAPVMSVSYSGCEAYLGAGGNMFHSTLWEQAAAEGITVTVAAGDSGSAGCDYYPETAAQYGLAVGGLASTPFNVAVGGTDFNDLSTLATYWNQTNSSPSQDSAKSYIPEIPWNDTCASSGSLNGCSYVYGTSDFTGGFDLVAGGGGPSSCATLSGTYPNVTCSGGYSKPSWQSGTGVPSDGVRDIPDLSLFAGNAFNASFYVLCQMDANAKSGGSSTSCDVNAPYYDFQAAGGTSASAQVFAGIMAMVNQAHGRQGNPNYVLYPLAAQAGNTCVTNAVAVSKTSCIFYDVTTGNNSVICQGGSPNCSNTNPASDQYGITVAGGSAAYGATGGFDLATGLGSVNVANLVNNWTSVSFTPSTTTLSLSTSPPTNPITLTHGQPINFTINVASGSGTPAGDVSLIAQTGNSTINVTGIGPFTLSGGSVSGSTVMLPGGSYNVTAHYAGNGTFAASDSTPGIPVTVGKESSLTEVRLATPNAGGFPVYNVTTVPYGSVYILRMDVTNSSGQLCANQVTDLISYPCPTGALTVSPAPTEQNPPSGTVPGSYTLNSEGYAEDQPIQESPGTYNFVASYGGDNSYTASTSPTVPITITPAPTTMDLNVQPLGSIANGETVYLQSYVYSQSNGAPLGGTVTYYAGNTKLSGTVQVQQRLVDNYQGLYVFAYFPLTGVGSVTITGQYSGDVNYAPSITTPGVTVNLVDYSVTANPPSITIAAPGQSGTSTISITPQNGFSGSLYLNVISGCPTGAMCTVSAVTVSGTSPATTPLTITTTAPANNPPAAWPRFPSSYHLPVGFLWLVEGLLALLILLGLYTPRWRPTSLLYASVLLAVGAWVACGGGGGTGSGGGSDAPPLRTQYLNPNVINFPDQYIGSTSATQSVTLSNTGNATLSISSITLTGPNSGDFAQTSTCGSSVTPGSACTISATFSPTAAGYRFAYVGITSNTNNYNTDSVQLSGTGVQPSSNVSLSPGSLTFSSQNENTTSPPQNVTLTNIGSTPLAISRIDTEGLNYYDFNQTNNCGSSLAASGTCTITVTFDPLGTGSSIASLGVYDGPSGSEQIVNLSGTALPPATPPGSYTVVVQASAMGDVHSLKIPVTVQ